MPNGKYAGYSIALFEALIKKILEFDQLSGCTAIVERPFFNKFEDSITTGISIIRSGQKTYWDKELDLLFMDNQGLVDIFYVNKVAFVPFLPTKEIQLEKIANALWHQFDLKYVAKFLNLVKRPIKKEEIQDFILQSLFPLLLGSSEFNRTQNFVFQITDKICVAHCYWGCSVDIEGNQIHFH